MGFLASNLVSNFGRAGLHVHVSSAPLTTVGTSAIVQLDIARGRSKRDEHFRLWPGASTNRIEVQGVDSKLEQLVLMIHEKRRRFEIEMNRRQAENTPGLTIVRVKHDRAFIERFTDDRKRHFLCGMDEQHCFIAQLPEPVSTVAQAHGVLKPAGLHELQAKAKSSSVRQGEFFFVPVPPADLKRFTQLASGVRVREHVGIAAAANWVRAGRQHVADAVWPVAVQGEALKVVLVKGHVRHPDHKTVYFSEWMRVLQNREAYEAPPPGVLWVD